MSNIFHGYDSMYYVLNKNSNGHILPIEYNNANFNSTFGKYFELHISNWFEKYSRKVVLTIDNTKDRIYKENGTNYLNLFSGYKFNKNHKKDLDRIAKGSEGVKFIWNHIKEIWNSNNEQCFEYDQKWIRKLINGYKLLTMLYLKGKMGRGKTSIVKFIMKVLGLHTSLTLSNDAPFMTEFNGSLVGVSLCLLDEIVHDFGAFKSLYNKLKPYVTDETMAYRNLYEKLKQLKNLTSFIMSGNYDMLKLDDPTKGEDRRIKINDVADIVKDAEYCNKLDSYLQDEDVMYSFFWDCIDNYKEFNEGQELKLLPITETKKNMIAKSLDSSLLFLKESINNPDIIDKYIKPKDLYEEYCLHMNLSLDKKKLLLNKETFLEKMKDLKDEIKFEVKKLDKKNPTNYIYIDRTKLIQSFTKKHYFNEYDDVHEEINKTDDTNGAAFSEPSRAASADPIEKNNKLEKENSDLKKQIEELKKQLDLLNKKENPVVEEIDELCEYDFDLVINESSKVIKEIPADFNKILSNLDKKYSNSEKKVKNKKV